MYTVHVTWYLVDWLRTFCFNLYNQSSVWLNPYFEPDWGWPRIIVPEPSTGAHPMFCPDWSARSLQIKLNTNTNTNIIQIQTQIQIQIQIQNTSNVLPRLKCPTQCIALFCLLWSVRAEWFVRKSPRTILIYNPLCWCVIVIEFKNDKTVLNHFLLSPCSSLDMISQPFAPAHDCRVELVSNVVYKHKS